MEGGFLGDRLSVPLITTFTEEMGDAPFSYWNRGKIQQDAVF